jgi:hypothetical protein
MMSDRNLIVHLQKLVVMKDGEIGRLRDDLEASKRIINGLSGEWQSRYALIRDRMGECEQRVLDFLSGFKGEWFSKDVIEKRVLARYPFYSGGTVPRCCRSLESQGLLLVDYRSNEPYYTINLQSGMVI